MPDFPFDIQENAACFASTAHPRSASWQWVYARALVRPLAVCMLPLMIGGLVTVLQGYPALAYLIVGFPAALILAIGWTFFRMHATVAEIRVRPGQAAVQTVWGVLRRRPPAWAPIYEIRAAASTLTFGLGDTAYELDRPAWPEADALLEALKTARSADTAFPG